ncbi:MAG: ABC transporter substrate-binding protein [Janthinobacterium lividum]
MTSVRLTRRTMMLAGAAAAATSTSHQSYAADRPLIAVLEAEVVILDPHVTTAAITRTFGYHVWDVLFAMDAVGAYQPQMVGAYTVSDDKLRWHFTLRDGLKFHDGAPVTSADCVASLKRWAPIDSLGRMLLGAGAVMAEDGRDAFTITLIKPFPLMLSVLGKPNAPGPFIMPARIIADAGTGRIKEMIGSGPFRFVADQYRPGDSMVLARFDGYVPREEPADFMAGGKVVHVDQVLLRVMPDDATGVAALTAGEIDYMQYLPFDWLDRLSKTRDVKLMSLKGLDMFLGNFRLNDASGPFADPAIRSVLWKLVDQREMMQSAGIGPNYRIDECPSFFMCDTPLSTDAGSSVAKFDLAAAKAELAKTSYAGEPVIMLEVVGSIQTAAGNLLAQNMKQIGFTVDEQVMDWGTVLARRAKKDGWSLFPVYANGIDMASPLTNFYISNNCADYPGWSCDATMTKLLEEFAAASDEAEHKRIAAEIQVVAYRTTPCVMWGQFSRPAGYRKRLADLIQSSFPIFWNVRMSAA